MAKAATAKKTTVSLAGADAAERKKALETAIKQLERDYGAGTVMKLGENAHMEVQAVHTGSLSLDLALGIGGVPRGRIVEIFGSQTKFADVVGQSEQIITAKLSGRSSFTQENIITWSRALNIDQNEIGNYFFTQKLSNS